MPAISIYGVESDASLILDLLNQDENIAFIVKDGDEGNRSRWKAVREIAELPSWQHIWFVSNTRLPLLWYEHRFLAFVEDPWHGWLEVMSSHDKATPYWGPCLFPSIFKLASNYSIKNDCIQLSSVQWVNEKGVVDESTEKEIRKWWRGFERKLAKISTKVSRVPGGTPNAYCLPAAYELSLQGVTRNIN